MQKSIETQLLDLNQCPVCAGRERKCLFPIPRTAVYECRNCGLRYIDPCLSPESMQTAYESDETLMNFHSFHEGYYSYGNLATESKTLKDFRTTLAKLEQLIPEMSDGRRIFDVGFGNGFFLAVAKQRGWHVHGSDTSPKNLELAREKFALELTCTDFEGYDSCGMTYDAVSFWDLIEHLPNPHKVLKKAGQILKPNGYVLVGIPNDQSLLQILASTLYHMSFGKLKKGIKTIYFLEHVAYYNLKTLTELFRLNDFILRDYFLSSTDLAKYSLTSTDRLIASIILFFGKLTGLENRLVAIFQKKG